MTDTTSNQIDGDNTPRGGPVGGLDEMAGRIQSLLDSSSHDEQPDEAEPEQEAAKAVTDDEVEAEAPAQRKAETREAEPVEAEAEADATAEEDADAESDATATEPMDTLADLAKALGAEGDQIDEYVDLLRNQLRVPVKINGKEELVNLKEAVEGYQRFEDYNAKTRNLAEERRRFEAATTEAHDTLKARFERVAELTYNLEREAGLDANQLDRILQEQGADAYLEAKSRMERRQAALQAARQEMLSLNEQQLQQKQQHQAAWLEEQRKQMATEFPDATDPKKGTQLKGRWRSYLAERANFSEEEIGQIADHRFVRVIDDAMRWNDLQKAKPQREKKVAKLPKVVRSGKGEPPRRRTRFEEATSRLRSSHKPQDATAAIEELLKG